jgi:hypothetical protein
VDRHIAEEANTNASVDFAVIASKQPTAAIIINKAVNK